MRVLAILFLVCGCCFGETPGLGVEWNDEVRRKLEGIVVPELKLDDVSLPVAVEALRAKALEFDSEENPDLRRVRIGYERSLVSEVERLVRIEAKGATLGELLEMVALQCNRDIEVYRDGLVLRVPERQVRVDGLVTRHYRVPAHFLSLGSRSDGAPAVDDPFAAADEGGESVQLKSAKAILIENGLVFPDGAMAKFLPRSSMLIVRNTVDQHELVEVFTQCMGTGPLHARLLCRVDVEIYSMSTKTARELSRRAVAGVGGLALRARVDRLLEAGEANLVAAPGMTSRNGQRSKVESGAELRYVSGVKTEEGVDSFEFGTERLGATLEYDPVVGSDGEILEINVAIRVATGEPVFRKQALLLPSLGEVIEVDVPQVPSAELVTSCTVKRGIPQFLGVLGSSAEPGDAIVAFLTGSVEIAGATLEVSE